ncbi:MAG: Flagellar assembly protein FliH [Rhizobacter sp.]|nr:Flagellar assembly protein FliH [Rhizobacter sp.]
MTNSFDPDRRQRDRIPPQGEERRVNPYARFIPREELKGFSAWNPDALAGAVSKGEAGVTRPKPATPTPPPSAATAATPAAAAPDVDIEEQLKAVRQSGYQDGYRDGLAALDAFKQSFAKQVTAQVGDVAAAFHSQLDGVQAEMAQALARASVSLARQVVRNQLATQPQLVALVAQEAVEALLLSARHIVVRVNPQDHGLIAEGAADTLAARNARLVADPSLSRGGCRVESDIGVVDASMETRWRLAAGALGQGEEWNGGLEATQPMTRTQPSHDATE